MSPWTLVCLIIHPSGSLLVCANFCDFSREIYFFFFRFRQKRLSSCLGAPPASAWSHELEGCIITHIGRRTPGNWKHLFCFVFQNDPPGSWSPGMNIVIPSFISVELIPKGLYYCLAFSRKEHLGHAAQQASLLMKLCGRLVLFFVVDHQGRQTFRTPLGGVVECRRTSLVRTKWKVEHYYPS